MFADTMGVILVLEEFSARETWPLGCTRCGHLWQEEYLVRHLTDGHGHDVVLWLRSGVMVQPPWSGTNCPACGCDGVRVFPVGAHLQGGTPPPVAPAPALESVPAPDPALTAIPAVGAGASPARPRPRRRVSQPVLLGSLLAVAFLLFTGFELFEHMLPHH
ncbi:hypothetical protein ACFQVD_02755 [Streptosporangium amethystogenes subsp. fukuiense]|uniref:C2H2-type domain-containing protein n=1 Tax=Streptosporangium amethystogenes subsp. fukuiense TaxID=698418 RepID=A0ABW2SUB7_9ACTN